MTMIYAYPTEPLIRRHGPSGYQTHESYRDWLRDEFMFRCVYCLHRERWYGRASTFHVEHSVPVSVDPSRKLEYDNLLYACHACNLRKSDQLLPDPATALTIDNVRVYPDGTLAGLTSDADKVIRLLCLNSPKQIRWRRTWIRIIELAEESDPDLLRELMGYPADLPNLRRSRAPENTRPDGIDDSCFARRERGELPDVYLS